MKSMLAVALSAAALALAACGEEAGPPLEVAKACVVANDGKVFEIAGFIDVGASVFCSNTGGGPVRCGFDLKESAAGPRKLGVDIQRGSGANSVEPLTRGFRKSDIKIYDKDGKPLDLARPAKVTGKLSVAPNATACFITARKIEKA
jgi:hypothetical protein